MPFISLAGAVVIVEPVKKWVFKTPHTDRMACEKIFDDMKTRGITKVGLISGSRRLRQVDARTVPGGGAEVRHRDRRRRDLRRGRHRHDAQLTKIKARRACRRCSMRASARDRRSSPRTSASSASQRRSTSRTASPPRSTSSSRAMPPTACACRPPRCWWPTAAGVRSAEESGGRLQEGLRVASSAPRSRPSAATPTTV